MKIIKKIGNIIKEIVLFPIKLIKKIGNKIKKNKLKRYELKLNERLDLIKLYVSYCKKNDIDFNITSNYDNELILHLTNNTKFKVAKPIKTNIEKESE